MNKNIVNLTPHALNIVIAEDEVITIEPSGKVARVTSLEDEMTTINGIPIYRQAYHNFVDLPHPIEGTVYAVSALVRLAAPKRTDLVSPGKLLRDLGGAVVGCQGLIGHQDLADCFFKSP